MTRRLHFVPTALVLLAASACGAFPTNGSGNAQQVDFDIDGFTGLDISDGFAVEVVVQPGEPSIEVTVDDNIIDRLDVELDGDNLKIGFVSGRYNTRTAPTAIVTMPELESVDLSGTASLSSNTIVTDNFVLDASGASEATLEVIATTVEIDSSGASDVEIEGSSSSLTVDASGASALRLGEFETVEADGDLSGASSLDLGDTDSFRGDISGASILTVPQDADVVADLSGSSTVSRR